MQIPKQNIFLALKWAEHKQQNSKGKTGMLWVGKISPKMAQDILMKGGDCQPWLKGPIEEAEQGARELRVRSRH